MRYYAIHHDRHSAIRTRDLGRNPERVMITPPNLPPVKIDRTTHQQSLRAVYSAVLKDRPPATILCEVNDAGEVRAWLNP